jgi:putative heme-binding domain-containing protein
MAARDRSKPQECASEPVERTIMHHILFGCMLLLTMVTGGPYAKAEESTLESAAAFQPMERARATVANPQASIRERVAAIEALGGGPNGLTDEDVRVLHDLMVLQTPLAVQLAAVDVLSRFPDSRITLVLLADWTRLGPKVHRQVVAALLWRDPCSDVLHVDAAARPELAAALTWARRDVQLRHPDPELRRQAESLLGRPETPPVIRDVLDKFVAALGLPGDAARGQQVFVEATCANCHKLGATGRHVGPDLARLTDQSRRYLLQETLDPNRILDLQYLEYTFVSTQGRVLTGMLVDEDDDTVTLADTNGEPHVIARHDLDDWHSSGRSQMPEGLATNLTLPQMADLLAFMVQAHNSQADP